MKGSMYRALREKRDANRARHAETATEMASPTHSRTDGKDVQMPLLG